MKRKVEAARAYGAFNEHGIQHVDWFWNTVHEWVKEHMPHAKIRKVLVIPESDYRKLLRRSK